MKIENNESTRIFLDKIQSEVVADFMFNSSIDKYINRKISKVDEAKILDIYNDFGVPTKTIKYDSRELIDNPFYKNIKLSNIKNDTVYYKNMVLPARTCLGMSYLKELEGSSSGYRDIGYFDRDVNIPILYENKDIWMSPTIAETRSMQRDIELAHGNVLTFGLGIGYYVYMCLLKDEVDSVTIVELNSNIIEMFNEHILPQFKTDKKINIIHGDMYDYYNEEFLNKFDYTFVDVWKDNEDGYTHYQKLMSTGIRKDNIGYWIEESIVKPIKMTMQLYFKSLLLDNYMETVRETGFKDLIAVHRYFRNIDRNITTYEEIIELINDRDVIRDIAGIKI